MLKLFCLIILLCFCYCPGPYTTKRRTTVVFEGYIWRRHKLIENGATQVWACTKKTCPARAKSPVGTETLKVERQHEGHRSSATEIELREAISMAKESAIVDSGISTRRLIAQASASLSDDALRKFDHMKVGRTIQRQREVPGKKEVDAIDLKDVKFTGDFSTDMDGGQFFRYDSRSDYPDDPMFAIFVSDAGIQRMKTFLHYTADGTFKVAPRNVFQLYTINVIADRASIPSVFVLMSDKSERSYTRVLTAVNDLVNAIPTSVMMDFELASRNAFQAVFPTVRIRHCIFHLSQSVYRNVQAKGLVPVYNQMPEFKKIVRSFAALSFLPTDIVPAAFDLLAEEFGNIDFAQFTGRTIAERSQNRGQIDPASILSYFKKYYIDGENGNDPIFPPDTWNHHYTEMNGDLGRTNNGQESYHKHMNSQFPGTHPSLSKVIVILKTEDQIATQKLRPHILDPTEHVQIYPRKEKYVVNDKAISDMVKDLAAVPDPTDAQVLAHLFALQRKLGLNDLWND